MGPRSAREPHGRPQGQPLPGPSWDRGAKSLAPPDPVPVSVVPSKPVKHALPTPGPCGSRLRLACGPARGLGSGARGKARGCCPRSPGIAGTCMPYPRQGLADPKFTFADEKAEAQRGEGACPGGQRAGATSGATGSGSQRRKGSPGFIKCSRADSAAGPGAMGTRGSGAGAGLAGTHVRWRRARPHRPALPGQVGAHAGHQCPGRGLGKARGSRRACGS